MFNHQTITRYLLAMSFFAIAMAIAYFAHALIFTTQRLPAVVENIDSMATRLDQVLDELDRVNTQIPPIIDQLDKWQGHVPAILAEVKASREAVPAVLDEVKQVRQQVPAVLAEVQAVRQELPAILQETAALREMIPPVLEQANVLITEAKGAGKKASEGAVKGVFTGIIKLPFTLLGGLGKNLFPKSGLAEGDYELIKAKTEEALTAGVGSVHKWENSASGFSGEVHVLSESMVDGDLCRQLRQLVKQEAEQLGDKIITLCRNEKSEWKLVD